VKNLTLQVLTLSATVVCGAVGSIHADESTKSLTQGEQPAEQSPSSLVDAMSMALKTLNYEGTFVHVQGTSVTSMHILHTSDAQGELERMTSLDGEAREIIRDHSLVTCIWPGTESVVVSKSKPRDLLPEVTSSLTHNDSYTFKLDKPDRVAGRDTYVVDVQPRDKYRYGYRFWIDQETNMLLRSMLLDGPDLPVEQVLFTAIDYPEKVDRSRFNINSDADQISWVEPKTNSAIDALATMPVSSYPNAVDRVGFSQLPQGYEEVSETYRPMPINDGPISHVMVSDGMASVSVYVEHVAIADQDNNAVGLSRMGAMNAYGLSLDKAFITVVGEVPASTVMAIAEAVLLRP